MAVTVESFAREVASVLGARLVSLVLYGSAARGDPPVGADVNTVLVTDAADEPLFAALEPVVRPWVRAGHPAPLIFAEAEWRESADVFAIEFEEMRAAHRLLSGRDLFHNLVVRREDLRRQLEAELRGKLVRLRQAYVTWRSDGAQLTRVVSQTTSGLLTMLRTVLRVGGVAVPPDPEGVVRAAAALVGFPPTVFDELVAPARSARLKLGPRDPRAAAYLDVLARTAEFVDRLT
ncbi:MAG TPA: hypothetical protein VN848_08550 [Gemmatimonadales bacterium]|nr:hypothetical protein [Gemmatimonadales bacterium]